MKLTMERFLKAVSDWGMSANEFLLELGFHQKQINAKALKAARKGYTEYGVISYRCWLTPKGREYLGSVS